MNIRGTRSLRSFPLFPAPTKRDFLYVQPCLVNSTHAPPPPTIMSGSVQISSPSQLSSLLSSSRIVVVNCKMRRVSERPHDADAFHSLQ